MKIETIKLFKNKETGALYGMRLENDSHLIPDPENAWKRLKTPGKGWDPQSITDDLILVDFPDEVYIYVKQN